MKILHVCGQFKTGGITTFVRSLLELNKTCANQHDLVVLYEDQEITLAGTRVHCLGKFLHKPIKFFFMIQKIAGIYDAVMLHKARPLVVFSLLFTKKRIFIFQHGMAVSRGTPIKRLLKKTWYSVLPTLLNAKVICSTDFAFQKTRKSGIRFSSARLEIIPFGIKIARRINQVLNQRERESKKEIFVGSAGVLSKIKRFDVLIGSLVNYTGELKINLKIAGDGPEKELLFNLAGKVNRGNVKIEFLGNINIDDMTAFYDSLDLFVFPSRDESFGLVVLEALSRGIPVALFPDAGGALALVENNRNGLVLNDGPGGLEELWAKLNKNPFMFTSMVEYINKADLSAYDIKFTRLKLENLVQEM